MNKADQLFIVGVLFLSRDGIQLDTSNFSLQWSSEGSLIYTNEEFGEDITNTRLNATATEHMKAEHCKRIFDLPCNCFFEVT